MKVGIDLGTTFSAVAFCEDSGGKPSIEHIALTVADGAHQVRSAVYLDPGGNPIVGSAALNMLAKEPDRVIQWIKRDMGEDAPRTVDGKTYTPPEISAEILKVLKKDTEAWVGEPIDGAVVCVPAWFGDRQREATRQAVELAGLPLIDLLAEPSAAALAVSLERPDDVADKDILVYDLGGGTFDVVLIRTKKDARGRLDVQTLCLAGDRQLGGHDVDVALSKHIAQRCEEQFGHNPELSDDRREWFILLDNVERNKREFSMGKKEITVPCDLRGHSITVNLDQFNEVTETLVNTTGTWVDVVLKEAEEKHGIKRSDMVVLLCGGSSKLPGVRPMLVKAVGREPLQLRRTNPELMVVRGAAYLAFLSDQLAPAAEKGGKAEPIIRVEEKYKAVGVEVVLDDGPEPRYANEVVLPDGSPADKPCTQQFEIAEDDQTELEISILQGSDPDPDKCERIGSLMVQGLPPSRKAGSPVEVTIWYDNSGILQCKAVDKQSGAQAQVALQR